MLFDWKLILYGTETDPFRSLPIPRIPPSSRASTTVTEPTKGTPRVLSGQCLQTGSGNKYLR